MSNNITIKVTLESNGGSQYGAVQNVSTYTVCHACDRYADLNGNVAQLNEGKERAVKLINRAFRTNASVLIEVSHYTYEPGVDSKDIGAMWVKAHRWGANYDVYERSEWKTDTVASNSLIGLDAKKCVVKGLNNLLTTCAETFTKLQA